jgi:hypothetical protein
MATQRVSVVVQPKAASLKLSAVAAFRGLRVLTWQDDVLYASRGYELLRAKAGESPIQWERVARACPLAWRNVSSRWRLSARLCRDGFHALAVLSTGDLIGAIPKAIVRLIPGEAEFRLSHRVQRGIRPLHIAVTPKNQIFWGEYFDNPLRDEVHIFGSSDHGAHWDVAHTFARGAIRHVHNIVYDQWDDCLWILTGDNGDECRVLRASCDFKDVETVLAGRQQTRAVALVSTHDAIYFSSDTPSETNHVYRLNRRGNLTQVASLNSSSICGCRVGEAVFFSTMVEPSKVNLERNVRLYGGRGEDNWVRLQQWAKDSWPMGLFQYGNAFLPDGNNATNLLAITTVAVEQADCQTTLWRVSAQ